MLQKFGKNTLACIGITCCLSATVCALPASAAQPKQNDNYNTFTEWCENKERISAGVRQTVEVLLKKTESQTMYICSSAK